MCEGTLEELGTYKNRETLSLDRYINIVSKKTASLFEASATVGATIGGAREDEIKSLAEYGRLLGIAYQIQDDLSDLGKNIKINILSLLDTNLEKNSLLQEISRSHVTEAKKSLEMLKSSEAKNLLMNLADFVISRSIDRT